MIKPLWVELLTAVEEIWEKSKKTWLLNQAFLGGGTGALVFAIRSRDGVGVLGSLCILSFYSMHFLDTLFLDFSYSQHQIRNSFALEVKVRVFFPCAPSTQLLPVAGPLIGGGHPFRAT